MTAVKLNEPIDTLSGHVSMDVLRFLAQRIGVCGVKDWQGAAGRACESYIHPSAKEDRRSTNQGTCGSDATVRTYIVEALFPIMFHLSIAEWIWDD